MSKVKQLLIVIPICIILAGLAVLLYLLDPTFEPDFYHISSLIIVTVFAFFITPSCIFAFTAAKEYYKNETFEQSFRSGVRLGLYFGLAGLIILGIIVSPVTGTMWFVQTTKEIISHTKEKKEQTNKADGSEIFDI